MRGSCGVLGMEWWRGGGGEGASLCGRWRGRLQVESSGRKRARRGEGGWVLDLQPAEGGGCLGLVATLAHASPRQRGFDTTIRVQCRR